MCSRRGCSLLTHPNEAVTNRWGVLPRLQGREVMSRARVDERPAQLHTALGHLGWVLQESQAPWWACR